MNVADIARVCHEANRSLQVVQADPSIPISPHWDELSVEMKDSIIDGVMGVLNGLTPEESHANWMDFKSDHGWRLGPVKDEANKQHPLMVPYAQLPPTAKIKDQLFGAIVHALKYHPTLHTTDQESTTMNVTRSYLIAKITDTLDRALREPDAETRDSFTRVANSYIALLPHIAE